MERAEQVHSILHEDRQRVVTVRSYNEEILASDTVKQLNSDLDNLEIPAYYSIAVGGALVGLFITNSPLRFMVIMGMISLTGIVVRNGIILIEFIEQERNSGFHCMKRLPMQGRSDCAQY